MSADSHPAPKRGGRVLIGILVAFGVGLVAAPGVFQMFTRAPLGAEMINEFRPFMTEKRLDAFASHLGTIDAAHREIAGADLPQRLGVTTEEFRGQFPEVARFQSEWPAIFQDMDGMLANIRANLDNFAAIDALPSFVMFPWFFVIPGVAIAALAFGANRDVSKDKRPGGKLWLLVAFGLAVAIAPAPFAMFTRAPLGGEMIEEFRPLMTAPRVADIQGYFLTIGAAEGELRNSVAPALQPGFSSQFPETARFLEAWPGIAANFAPMVGTMSDNVDNFAAVGALPPFSLFPWFFVIPGLVIAAVAFASEPALLPGPLPPLIRPRPGRSPAADQIQGGTG